MRHVLIDLSSDNFLQQPQIFGGYAGEHNETVVQVTLPKRLVEFEYSGYYFVFQTSEENEIWSPLIPVSEISDGIISCKLTEQVTIAGKLLFNITAQLINGDIVEITSKTNMCALYIDSSPDGNNVDFDPNSWEDELLKMVDGRILQLNPSEVDQYYIPDSIRAQSGVAVAEAVSTKMDKFGEVTIQPDNSVDLSVGDNPFSIRCTNWSLGDSLYITSDKDNLRIDIGYQGSSIRFTGVDTPTEDYDATNKQYVDNAILTAIGTALEGDY